MSYNISSSCLYIPPIRLFSQAILVTLIEAPRLTAMDGVGVVAASSTVASTYAADTDTQHPQGTVIGIDVFMCEYSSTAAGFTIATLSGIAMPFRVIAIAIGVTAPPSGNAQGTT